MVLTMRALSRIVRPLIGVVGSPTAARHCSTSAGSPKGLPESVISFNNIRQRVYDELENNEQVAGVQWRRFTGFNALLKGHRPAELTILTGLTGSGKTTFLSEYSLDLCEQGVPTLWGSFEIQNVRLSKMMLCQFAGTKFHNEELINFDYHADAFSQLPMYLMDFHGQQSLDDVLATMTRCVSQLGVRHIVLDNLQFMIGCTPPQGSRYSRLSRWEYQDLVVGSFRQFATGQHCHITLVIHPRKELGDELTNNSVFGGGKATQEADNILILQKKACGHFKTRKYVQVTKNRFDGELGLVNLNFDKRSLTFSNHSRPAEEQPAQKPPIFDITYRAHPQVISR